MMVGPYPKYRPTHQESENVVNEKAEPGGSHRQTPPLPTE